MSASVVLILAGLSSVAVAVEGEGDVAAPVEVTATMTPEEAEAFSAMVKEGLSAADLAAGEVVYEDYCAACHGYDGINLLPEVPSFLDGKVFKSPDARLFQSVRDGRGDIMPPWIDELSVDEIFAALAFAKQFAPKTEDETNEAESDES